MLFCIREALCRENIYTLSDSSIFKYFLLELWKLSVKLIMPNYLQGTGNVGCYKREEKRQASLETPDFCYGWLRYDYQVELLWENVQQSK